MKKNNRYKTTFLLLGFFSLFGLSAQQVNTMYFMENVPVRSYLNPAFQPLSNFYLGFPVLGYTQFSFGNNALALKDVAYNDANGKPIWFLNKNGDKDKFFNGLKSVTNIQQNYQINILDFGFRTGRAYWSFSITEKAESHINIPKDLFKLLLYGTPDTEKNTYDFTSLGADMTVYTEIGLGYSRNVNEKLSIGVKPKLLLGTANSSGSSNDLKLIATQDAWNMVGNGSFKYSSPIDLNGNKFDNFDPITDISTSQWFKPSGIGAGIDLGAVYKLTDRLTLSGAVTDLGFIRWTRNLKKMGYKTNYKFNGINNVNINNTDMGDKADSVYTDFKNNLHDTITDTKPYTSYTSPKINVGAEYAFWNNKLSVGLLSRTQLHNKKAYEELTGSVNLRPTSWFNLSGSYSVLNGRASNIGAGLGLRTGFLHWFLSTDYVPLKYATITTGSSSTKYSVPYNTQGLNLALGVNFVFGNKKDADHDGVPDKKDKCPDTPRKVAVDKNGCPLDTDGDGVPDYLDKCPGTPKEAYGLVDANGCPLDTDGDGVPDYMDKCPNTPPEAKGFVDKNGCLLDTDGDGVPDYLDECPDTPAEAKGFVDKKGCLLDTDGDGIPDYLDKCPNTPAEFKGYVDKNGCVLDADGDGVPDNLDKCPDTPVEARGKVDKNGCPLDTDGDGIPDYLDKCPTLFGTAANHGCPEIKKEVKTLFKKALQGIQFATGKDLIVKTSYPILNQIATVLKDNPTYLIEVRGHTDNVGNAKLNQVLSQKRAEAVRKYLIGRGVDAKRMMANGYGDTIPVSTNATSAGRALNRRVEFEVSFEEVSLK